MGDNNHISLPDYADNGISLIDDIKNLDFKWVQSMMTDNALLIFVKRGYMHTRIDNGNECIEAHQILFCTHGKSIGIPAFSDDFLGHGVLISLRFGQLIMARAGNIWNYLTQINSRPVLSLPQSSLELLRQYYTLLWMEVHRKGNLYYQEVVTSLVCNLLYTLINDMRRSSLFNHHLLKDFSSTYKGSPQTLSLFHRFMDLLVNAPCTHRNTEYYAKKLCVGAKYLSAVCKTISGRTAREWICDTVVNSIEGQLRYSDKSITEISLLYDFPDLSSFSKFVKRYLGATPNQLRHPQ